MSMRSLKYRKPSNDLSLNVQLWPKIPSNPCKFAPRAAFNWAICVVMIDLGQALPCHANGFVVGVA